MNMSSTKSWAEKHRKSSISGSDGMSTRPNTALMIQQLTYQYTSYPNIEKATELTQISKKTAGGTRWEKNQNIETE